MPERQSGEDRNPQQSQSVAEHVEHVPAAVAVVVEPLQGADGDTDDAVEGSPSRTRQPQSVSRCAVASIQSSSAQLAGASSATVSPRDSRAGSA